MKNLILVALFAVLAISCTKKPTVVPVKIDVDTFLNENCFAFVAEGVKVHTQLAEKHAEFAKATKAKKSSEVYLFNNKDLDSKIRTEIQKPEPRSQTFANLEKEIAKVDATFAQTCKDGLMKAYNPCIPKQNDKGAFELCFQQELKTTGGEWMNDVIRRASNYTEFEKRLQALDSKTKKK